MSSANLEDINGIVAPLRTMVIDSKFIDLIQYAGREFEITAQSLCVVRGRLGF